MTCMPASRRARATTLMPRSWPSSPTLASTMRIGGLSVIGSLKETLHLDSEIAQHPGERQLFVRPQDLLGLIGMINVDLLLVRVEHADRPHAGFEVFTNFFQDPLPAVVGRQDLENQARLGLQIAVRQTPPRHVFKAVISHVRSPNSVRVSLRNDPGIV